MARILLVLALLTIAGSAFAESVDVKYRGLVALDNFHCQVISRSSFIERVCYDDAHDYMLISLEGQYYGYCGVDKATLDGLLTALSMGRFYVAKIRSKGTEGPFDCRSQETEE